MMTRDQHRKTTFPLLTLGPGNHSSLFLIILSLHYIPINVRNMVQSLMISKHNFTTEPAVPCWLVVTRSINICCILLQGHALVERVGFPFNMVLTHWVRMTHICVSELTTIGSDNDLSPGRRQAIIWTHGGILLIGPLGTNFSETFYEIHTFLFKENPFEKSSGKWRPFCLDLNVLMCGTVEPKMRCDAHCCLCCCDLAQCSFGLPLSAAQAGCLSAAPVTHFLELYVLIVQIV